MVTARLTFERSRLTKLQNSYPLATPERLYRPFTEKLSANGYTATKCNETIFHETAKYVRTYASKAKNAFTEASTVASMQNSN